MTDEQNQRHGPYHSSIRRLVTYTSLVLLAFVLLFGVGVSPTLAYSRRAPTHSPSHTTQQQRPPTKRPRSSAPGSLIWRYQTGDLLASSKTVVNGILYVGSGDYSVYAFNAASGALLWSYRTGYYITSAPVVVGGVVYVGSQDGDVYAFNAASGALLWRYQTSGTVVAAPTVVNGVVYVGSYFDPWGTIYALNAANGSPLWSAPIAASVDFSPIIAGGVVYTVSDAGVYAFDAASGSQLWQYSISGPTTPLVLAGGLVYVGVSNILTALNAASGAAVWTYQTADSGSIAVAPVVSGGIVYIGSEATPGDVYAFNAASGALLWSAQTGVYDESPLTVTNGVVYIASLTPTTSSFDGIVFAFNAASGALLWSYQTGEYQAQYLTALTVTSGVIYFGAVDHFVYALNATSGALLWSYLTGGEFFDSPTVTGGILYIGSSDNYLYALAAPSTLQPPVQGPTGTERYGGNSSELLYCYQCAGDPIDTYSGNFSHTFTDLSISGRGIPLSFTRTYNAGAASQNGPLGYGWTDDYNWSLAVDGTTSTVTITQENGSTVTFAPNGSGGYTPPSRVLATLVKNGDGSYTFTRIQDQTHYTFNPAGQLLSETDRNGYTTTLAYNGGGQLTTVTDPAGRTLVFTYDGSGHILSVTDPLGRTVAFIYDGSGNLQTASDVNGGATSFTYDANHLLLTMTDPRGGTTTNVYDSSGRVTSQTDPLGRKTTFSYTPPDGNGNSSTTTTDPNGNVTLDQYYNGLLMSETKGYGTPAAATTSYTYDPLSLGVASITDPNGNITSQTWDASGNLLSSTDPLGRTTTYTYDTMNDVTSATDPTGVTTSYAYDGKGNLLTSSRPLAGTSQTQTTTYTYGDSAHPGDVTATTDPNGHTTTYTYDANGNRTSVSDPLGDTTTEAYNRIGWRTAQVSPNGNVSGGTPSQYTTSYTYDNFGDVTLVTDPLGGKTASQYDADRNLVQQTDADGHVTSYAYDLDNELTQVTRQDGTLLTYTYDADGNQLTQTDGAGHTTHYAYDQLNRLTSLTDPLNRTTRYTYDPAGNRIALTDPSGRVTTSTYDAANELTGIAYSDGTTPTVAYTYDADGRRASMTDGTGTTSYTYDSLNRLAASTNGAGATVAYGYDLADNLTSLTYPGSPGGSAGQTVTRSYDAANRLTAVTDWQNGASRFRYDADGNLTQQAQPTGTTGTFTYDRDDRVLTMVYGYTRLTGGKKQIYATPFLTLKYTRDALGQLTSAAPQPSSATQPAESYTYTALNQLSAVNTTANTTPYSYDTGDNIIQDGTRSLTYDAADQLTSVTQGTATTRYTYDQQGNRTTATSAGPVTTTYTYDQANRLSGFTSGSTSASYTYNGDGLRMSKSVNGAAAEPFTWDTAEALPLLLVDGAIAYIYGPGGLPIEQITTGGSGGSASSTLYYAHDQLGSTRALTNGAGVVVATYTFDAYGNTTAHTGTASTPLQFASQYTDAESSLIYLRARFYDPTTGQFLSVDPLTSQTKARYGYANDDPLNLVDSSGFTVALGCDTLSASWFYSVQVQICVGQGPQETIFTETLSTGIQSTPGLGATTGLQVDPGADTAKDLQGNSAYVSGNAGIVNASTAFNTCSGGPPSYDVEFGPKTDPGFGGGTSHTWAQSGPPVPPDFTIFPPLSSLFSW